MKLTPAGFTPALAVSERMGLTDKTRKILWGRSGNRCAICRTELVIEKDPFNRHLNIGEECHIISKKDNGPRHRNIPDFNYDSSVNLLLLCCNDHTMIDEQIEKFTEDTLLSIKIEHEKWVTENLGGIQTIKTEEKEPSRLSSLIDFVTNKHDIEMNIKSSKQILESQEGLQMAFTEVAKIKEYVIKIVTDIKKEAPEYHIHTRDNNHHICDIIFKGHTLLVQFYQAYGNVANNSYLLFGLIEGFFDKNGYADPFHPATVKSIIRLDFSFNNAGEFGWRNQERISDFYSSQDITEIWTEKFFKEVLK